MKTCPICKSQYDDACPVCSGDGKVAEQHITEWVHVTTAANEIEMGIIAGLLEMAGIPVNSRAIGVDRYVGVPIAGLDIRVPADRYEEALQVLNAKVDEEDFIKEELVSEDETVE